MNDISVFDDFFKVLTCISDQTCKNWELWILIFFHVYFKEIRKAFTYLSTFILKRQTSNFVKVNTSGFVDLGLDVWSDKQVIEKEDCRLNWNHLNSLNESSPNMIKICHKKSKVFSQSSRDFTQDNLNKKVTSCQINETLPSKLELGH